MSESRILLIIHCMTSPIDRRAHSFDEAKVQQSLTACWKDGAAAQVMGSIMDTYTLPLGLLLGANNVQIAALVAIPNLLASLAQLAAVGAVTRAKSRLSWVVRGVAIQAVMLVAAWVCSHCCPDHGEFNLLIAGITIYKILNSAVGPAWGSLVSEYLPPDRRGDYFGWRSRVLGITSISTLDRQWSDPAVLRKIKSRRLRLRWFCFSSPRWPGLFLVTTFLK